MGDGGSRSYVVSGPAAPLPTDYYTGTRLERLPNPTGALTGFRLLMPDGRREYYTNLVDFASGQKWAFREAGERRTRLGGGLHV